MELFDVILKLIRTLTLTSSEEHQQLTADVKGWRSDATENSDDKMKQMYAKIHKGVFVRLLMPFVYFWVLKSVQNMSSPEDDDFL